MLDRDMLEQLKVVFEKLQGTVELVYHSSNHPKQQELLELLSEVASTSSKIVLTADDIESATPHFYLKTKERNGAISFAGIPGGHEFTSLILAILNSDHQGRLPDEAIIRRIQELKGPIELETYISLSCENCPEVIQALNLMAIFHPQFKHQMRDGEFFQEEISKLNIQGVPSVIHQGSLISSGKTDLPSLLSLLEKRFGVERAKATKQDLGHFDVVVIGGGPGGSSAAIYSARKGLKTAIIAERIGGQVKDTKGIENLISIPYTEGPLLADNLGKHLREYPIELLEYRRVLSLSEEGKIKKLELDSGELLNASAIIIATGAKWRELGIPGEKEYIGRGVAFCPHCDGPYYKGKDIAVIGGGNSGVEAALDLSGIVQSVTLFEFLPELKADRVLVEKLQKLPNVKIITNAKTTEVLGDGKKVVALRYQDRLSEQSYDHPLDGIFVQIGLMPNSSFVKEMVEVNRMGEIVVDEKCRTSKAGIYAAGDVTTVPYKQIIISMGEGAKAALAAFEDLKLKN